MQTIKNFTKLFSFKPTQEMSTQTNELENLPEEIFLTILDYVDFKSLLAVNQTSKRCNKLTNHSRFWKEPNISSDLYSNTFYSNFFQTLNNIRYIRNDIPIPVAFVTNQNNIRNKILEKKFKLSSSILTTLNISCTKADLNAFSFLLHEDRSFLFNGMNYNLKYNLMLLKQMLIILLIPKNPNNLELLTEELMEFNKDIFKHPNYNLQPVKPLVFTLVDNNTLFKINNSLYITKTHLEVMNFFVELPKITNETHELYDLDQILHHVDDELNQIMTRHMPLLTKQERILKDMQTHSNIQLQK